MRTVYTEYSKGIDAVSLGVGKDRTYMLLERRGKRTPAWWSRFFKDWYLEECKWLDEAGIEES